jgi:hypothetical protein
MPVLGVGGRLRLKREAPDATVLPSSALASGYNSIYIRNPGFWSGDFVTISSTSGLPIDTSTDGPDCPDGHAMYQGSDWYVGSNRSHIASEVDHFYDAANADPFYMREEECGLTISQDFYIYRDQLDRISFYTSRAAALSGEFTGRVPLYNVDFGALILAAAGGADYRNAITDCTIYVGEYLYSDVRDEVSLASICDLAPAYTSLAAGTTEYDNADLDPRYYLDASADDGALWLVQANLQSWSLNLSAPEVDTTAVGEKFGEAVKSIVNGGGTFDFFVDKDETETSCSGNRLLELLLLTQKGCKAKAEFWMIQKENARAIYGLAKGDLYYTADILITSSAVNVRPEEVIAGSANFVTVGEIALKMGTN